MEWVLRIMANLLRPDELGPAEAAYKAVAQLARVVPEPVPASYGARSAGPVVGGRRVRRFRGGVGVRVGGGRLGVLRCWLDAGFGSRARAGRTLAQIQTDAASKPRQKYWAPVRPAIRSSFTRRLSDQNRVMP